MKRDLTIFDWVARGMVGACATGGVLLGGVVPASFADGNSSSMEGVAVNVASSCSMSSNVTSAHTATIANGSSASDIGSTSLKVVCNDKLGFQIYAIGYSETGGLGDTNLHSAEDSSIVIPTGLATSGDTSQWAMKLSATAGTYQATLDYANNTYAVVPSTSTKAASLAGVTDSGGSEITTTYQAYVSPTQSAGTYTGEVKYTLTHPKDSPTGITTLQYMQDMSDTVCAASPVGVMTTLIDKRDNKEYQVAKLKDGNCWMVDNLRYGGNTTGTSSSASYLDTDLASNTTFSLSGSTPTGSAYTTSTSWQGTNAGSEYYPDDGQTGGQYYGYYYNWFAAVAGTVSGGTQTDANYSICPKGWTLPKNGQYGKLLYSYNVIASATSSGYVDGGWSRMSAAPLQFLRAGYHSTSGTAVNARGNNGYYWSSSSASTTNAYNLNFNSGSVRPSYYSSKANGFTIRCIAR